MIKLCIICGKEKKHYAKGMCAKCYNKQYFKSHPEVRAKNTERIKERYVRMRGDKYKESYVRTEKTIRGRGNVGVCYTLKKHASDMKGDPEHLTTEFLQDLIGIKCKKKENNNV